MKCNRALAFPSFQSCIRPPSHACPRKKNTRLFGSSKDESQSWARSHAVAVSILIPPPRHNASILCANKSKQTIRNHRHLKNFVQLSGQEGGGPPVPVLPLKRSGTSRRPSAQQQIRLAKEALSDLQLRLSKRGSFFFVFFSAITTTGLRLMSPFLAVIRSKNAMIVF